jgi:hypothetical protein
MGELHYPIPMRIMYLNSPSLLFFWLPSAWFKGESNLEFKLLNEFEAKNVKILGMNRGPRWVLLMEKTVGLKSGATVHMYGEPPVYGAVIVYPMRLGGLYDSQATNRSVPGGGGGLA